VRFDGGHLDKVVEAINASGYGLTLGLHSRIASVADYVAEHARVGNLYVNRNQIGAVVGVQPFGGEGLSGTGPKAGGPNYVARFATERVRTTDITATGGNVALLGLDESE
jgi:RHH-type proline utilization regulon transcriptional repressor/proline dehydrogenase/delta 1-pyrroline-5-carboxylate dehydrogenase